jgi:hypothetical protein
MSSTVAGELAARLSARKLEAERRFNALALKVAQGGKVDVDEAEAIADAAGKAPCDLADAVEIKKARIAWRATADNEPALQAARSKAQDGLAAADEKLKQAAAKWDAARVAHTSAVQPLAQERVRIDQELGAAERARKELIASYPDCGELAVEVRRLQAEQTADAERFRAGGFNLDMAATQRRVAWQNEIDSLRERMGAEPA